MGNVSVLTLDAGPAAARRARHFVQESVGGPGRSDLTADVELVVTELVTNAFLHGEPPVRLAIDDDADWVRVEVTDAGALPPILVSAGSDAMTGRGLSLVAALAGRWGVDRLAGGEGKVVWAELGAARVPAAAGAGTPPATPAGEGPGEALYEVTIGSVATELLVAAKAHLDNVVRELVLLRGGQAASGVALPDEVAELVEIVTGSFAAARSQLKQQAMAALSAGQELTELVLHLPTVTARAGERYLDALDELDRYARAARMLSLAAPVEHRLFRRWYVRTIVEQLGALAAGREAPRARPFQLVLADEVAKTAPMVDTAARLAMLHQVNQRLAAALTTREMADIAVEEAITVLGVKTARVRLVEPDGTLRSIAWRGQPGTTDVSPAGYPIAADLPSSVAARTGQPGFVRSLGERLAGVPEFAERFSATRSARIMPLNAAGRTLGLLILTFTSGALGDEVEVALATSLADTLAQSLARAELAARDAERREVASFLADASQVLISARQPLDVLQGLADLAVPRLADWCTVYLPGDEPGTLRRAAIAIAGNPGLAERLKRQPLDLAGDTPHARVWATGRPEAVSAAGRLLEELYPGLDFEAMGGARDESSGLCLPVSLRGQVIGLIGVTQLTPGRAVTPAVTESLEGLAARAAVALDNTRRWSAQAELVQALVGALLPASPPDIAGLDVAARYRPVAGDVAGDWWEVDRLADRRVLIGVGDAAGHGLDAVTDMCELRHGARALAAVDDDPASLLSDLNRRLADRPGRFATAVYAVVDPDTGQVEWANAGHVPPIHVAGDGTVTVLGGTGPPLGSPLGAVVAKRSFTLAPGDTLILYSDGVVERREVDLGEGIDALVRTVTAHGLEPVADLADVIIAEHCEARIDDCCVLVTRRVS